MRCCTDCLILIANGDTPPELDETATAAWLAEIDRRWGDTPLTVGDEAGFSWSSCDCCGSTLGGDRHELFVVDTTPVSARTRHNRAHKARAQAKRRAALDARAAR